MILRLNKWFLTACCLSLFAIPAFAWKPPGGGGSTPPLPPVAYQIKYFYPPNVPTSGGEIDYLVNVFQGLNNSGDCVGSYGAPNGEQHAWLFSPLNQVNTAIDLNDIGAVGIPEGWVIAMAMDINDRGAIVGFLRPVGTPANLPGVRRGFVLDTSVNPPSLSLLPDNDPSWVDTYARRINENGDVLGVFQRSDGTWGAYLFKPALNPVLYNTPDEFPEIINVVLLAPTVTNLNNPSAGFPAEAVLIDATRYAFAYVKGIGLTPLYPQMEGLPYINDDGIICGTCWRNITLRKKTTIQRYIFRDAGTNTQEIVAGSDGMFAYGFNAHGTIMAQLSPKDLLYQDAWGFVDINSLVTGTPADRAEWTYAGFHVSKQNDTGPLGFGQIAGPKAFSNGSKGYYLLTPVSL